MVRLEDRGATGVRELEEPESGDRSSYLTWSCNALASALESEHSRVDSIRRNAHGAFLVVPVLIGLALRADQWKADDLLMQRLRLALLACGAAALLCWFVVMFVRMHPRVSVRVFLDDEGTTGERDYEARLVRARDYLAEAVTKAQDVGSKLAFWRTVSLCVTVVTIIVAGIPFLLEVL